MARSTGVTTSRREPAVVGKIVENDFLPSEHARRRSLARPHCRLACVAVLLCGLFVPACGTAATSTAGPSYAASPQALAAVTAAADVTAHTTARVAMTISQSGLFGGSDLHLLGATDFADAAGSLTLTPGSPTASGPSHTSLPVRFFHNAAYSRPLPGTSPTLPAGKVWLSVELGATEAVARNLPDFVAQLEGLNPVLTLAELRWGAVAAGAGVVADVDGTPATSYRVTVDLASALSKVQGFSREAVVAVLGSRAQLAVASPGRVDFTAWVGDGGHVLRIEAPSATGVGTTTITLSGFAQPVVVQMPDPGQTFDLVSLGPSAERENTGGGDSDGG